MNQPAPTRRSVLHGGLAIGFTSLAVVAVRGVTDAASAAVPTASSRTALATSTGCTTLTKEETQGPFWIDEQLNRSDIRYDTGSKSTSTTTAQSGVPLTITLTLQNADGCAPYEGAYVDIWHANAQGIYSDVTGSGNPDETGHNFLRGYQVSDSDGQVTFTTIWPGWYVSRTIHVHFRVRLALDSSTTVNFTSQLFFDETTNNTVLAQSAYKKSSSRDTTNSTDKLYDSSLLMPTTGSVSAGYAGAFTINLDLGDTATSTPTSTSTATATASPTATATTTATSTATTTATATTSPTSTSTATTSPTSTPTTTDTVVNAGIGAVTIKHRGRRRTIKVTVNAREKVAARVRLLDDDDVLATKTTGWLAVGKHTVSLNVPRNIKSGHYEVLTAVGDKSGNVKYAKHPIHLPAAK